MKSHLKEQDLRDAERRVVSAPFNYLIRRFSSSGQTGSSDNSLPRPSEGDQKIYIRKNPDKPRGILHD